MLLKGKNALLSLLVNLARGRIKVIYIYIYIYIYKNCFVSQELTYYSFALAANQGTESQD